MGFTTGFFQNADSSPTITPPWLSGIRCAGPEASVGACRRSDFGETSTCGPIQRLFCLSSMQGNGQARLVGGSADAGGAWEYGILEVLINSVYSIVEERGEDFGRRGAQVACRSLGFTAGAQLLAGRSSPLPAPSTSPQVVRDITCDGSEASLADCDIRTRDYDYSFDYGFDVNPSSVALICTTPSGCDAPASAPVDGDVRLVPLNGTAVATATCDEVHFGGVELFRDGIWGRICVGRFGGDPEEFTLDAQVVCRQLGFPFGSVMDEGEVFGAYDYSFDYSSSEPEPTVWATEVVCTGKEERLLDCDFPQNFGIDYEYERPEYEYANWPGSTHPAPEPAPLESAPAPAGGLPNGGCSRSDRNRLAVICRRFEITESDSIRR